MSADRESRTAERIELGRRAFVQVLGSGLLVTVLGEAAKAAQEGRRGGGGRGGGGGGGGGTVAARVHIGKDGAITIMTGKVEMGQGSRAEITQACAEELRVSPGAVRLIMGDTDLCPDDGTTAGSQTTPRTLPAVRAGTAAARELLAGAVARHWQVDRATLEIRDGAIVHAASAKSMRYAELAASEDIAKLFDAPVPRDIALTPTKEWKVLGTSFARPNARDLVTGAHKFPSDIARPNMLYGAVLRPPSYGARLKEINLEAAKAIEGVQVVREGEFVGCVAPNSLLARQGVKALAATASWETAPHPSSKEISAYLKAHAQGGRGGGGERGSDGALGRAARKFQQTYELAYIQHTPMETRAAVAEWNDGKLTVWTGSQAPNRVHQEVAGAFGLPSDRVRVIIPDFGCGFGGKHSGEYAVEAGRLARAAGRPVSLKWSREEEFTWAYYRPAAVIEIAAGLDEKGRIVAWEFTNINAGGAAVDTPYDIPGARCRSVGSQSPMKQGSYRTLAATGNNFARESFMDELATAAGADPLEFRLAHLTNPRLRAVLEKAAKRFGWAERRKGRAPGRGIGLACGTEKGSFVAGCVEVEVAGADRAIAIRRFCEAFECGAVTNPANLLSQIQGCIVMGLGGALFEAMEFEGGKVLNANLSKYRVPRFEDVPPIEIDVLDRPDLPSVGAGETPIIAIAPAIANAVFDAIGVRIRAMPIRIPPAAKA